MNQFRVGLLVGAGCLALAGCKVPGMGGAKAPTGQVVATVGDREITLRELHAEMAGAAAPADATQRKLQEQAAIKNIVARVVLAKVARDQGLDKTPDFVLQKDRAVDGLLNQSLQKKVIAQVPKPTSEEAQTFVAQHPNIFVERKIFLVDQIRMARPSDPSVLKALEPLKTLEAIEVELKKDHIAYQRASGTLDAVGPDPRLIEAVMKLPPGEIFVVPGPEGLLVNEIKETKIVPFTGEPATNYALQLIGRQRTQETLNRTFSQYLAAAGSTVRFNKDFAPPTAPAAPTSAGGKPAPKP
jgi:EpsD family peptidyl-prolyl cis-trans isomerase